MWKKYVALVQQIVSLYYGSVFKRDWILFHSLQVQKARVGARESVVESVPQVMATTTQSQQRVMLQSRASSSAVNHRDGEAPGYCAHWVQRNFIESPQEPGSAAWNQLCITKAPQLAALLYIYKNTCMFPESVTVSHWVWDVHLDYYHILDNIWA